MKKYYFKYGNTRSDVFGIYMQREIEMTEAVPRVQDIYVPGRNGLLHTWDGSYNSRAATATCYITSRVFPKDIREINYWLIGEPKYKKLVLEYDEEHFLLARAVNGVSEKLVKSILNPFAIDFECRPEKFLKSGENEITAGSTVYNPTHYPAHPIITVVGNGDIDLQINDRQAIFRDVVGSITIDTETGNSPEIRDNDKITFVKDLILNPGTNTVSVTEGATVKIIPRWWEL